MRPLALTPTPARTPAPTPTLTPTPTPGPTPARTPTPTLARALAAVIVLALAACGPGATPPIGPPPVGSTTPPVTDGGATIAVTPEAGAAAAGFDMKPVATTAMAADLQAIGLDPNKLPAMNKLEPEKLRKVMKLMSRALGAKCTDCHVEDLHATTPRKKIAERMWNDYARGLTMQDGAPVFCDACHQGKLTFLDRHDKKALGDWMDKNLVDRMKRKDGKGHECATCHGEEMSYLFLAPLRK